MRISGLASGMDIDSMVKQLMTARKTPLNKLNQQKQLMEWKREDYRTVSTNLVGLNDKLSTFSLSSSINSKKATISGAANVLTATASGASGNAVLNINVSSLATASNTVSGKIADPLAKLSNAYGGTETSVTINGEVIHFDASQDTLSSVLDKINNSAAGVTATLNKATGKIALTPQAGTATITTSGDLLNTVFQGAGSATKLSSIYSGTENSIAINGVNIEFNKDTDTLSTLVSKINSSSAGVTAIYDEASGKMSLTNKATGNTNITTSGGLLANIFDASASKTTGVNASVTINGIATTQASNRFTINGVEISLTGVSPTGQTTQVEVTQDNDKMVETIKSFVESYNSTLALLNSKTSEERFRKYLPLTTEQRADMKEDEIKLWDTKAKSGMLKNDTILEQTISSMRTALSTDVTTTQTIQVTKADGTTATEFMKVNLAQFGITTGNYSEKGKLYIDEKKLREALESNPAGATALFGQTEVTSGTQLYSDKDGVFSRIKKINNVSLNQLYEKAGTSRYSSDLTAAFMSQSVMGLQLTDYEHRIQDWTDRLLTIENRYYKQFTAMETAMNKYNSTSSSLTSMLS